MALDTNPNANMNMPTTGQPNTQPYTPANGVAAMVKAIMDGNAAYQAKQAKQGAVAPTSPLSPPPPAMSPGSMVPGATGPSSVGGPSGPTPLVNPSSMAGGLGGGVPTTPVPGPVGAALSSSNMGVPNTGGVAPPGAGIPSPSPTMTQGFPTGGASPVSMDPVTQALMSPIPGM
jgi:hypothetical protein